MNKLIIGNKFFNLILAVSLAVLLAAFFTSCADGDADDESLMFTDSVTSEIAEDSILESNSEMSEKSEITEDNDNTEGTSENEDSNNGSSDPILGGLGRFD